MATRSYSSPPFTLEDSLCAASALDESADSSVVAFGARRVHNGRDVQEDTWSVVLDVSLPIGGGVKAAADAAACSTRGDRCTPGSAGDDSLSWFAVFDGHGGHEVAEFAQAHLHRHFLAALAEQASSPSPPGAPDGAPPRPRRRLPGRPAHSHSASQDSTSSVSSGASSVFDRCFPVSCDTDDGADACSGAGLFGPHSGIAASAPSSRLSSLGLPDSAAASTAGAGTSAPVLPALPTSPLACAAARDALTAALGSAAAAAATAASPSARPPATGATGTAAAPQPPPRPAAGRRGEAIGRALRTAFIRTDRDLAGTEVGELVGSTALVAVVGRGEVHLAHCGDSRAVLCRKGAAVPLTSDHKAGRHDEAARVRASGGRVVYRAGTHRVMGMLACSRALGDHFLRPYVIAEPEVSSFRRSGGDELLLLATDGLWDVFEPEEAVHLALRSAHRARERGASRPAACRVAAHVLTRAAAERGSSDNITVVCVDLRSGGDAPPSLAAVLASQCSGEYLQQPTAHLREQGDRGAGGAEGGGACGRCGAGLGGAADGRGGGGGGGGWLASRLFSGRGGSVGGGPAAATAPPLAVAPRSVSVSAGGACPPGGSCAFRVPGKPRATLLRRASAVTPVAVSVSPHSDSARSGGSQPGASVRLGEPSVADAAAAAATAPRAWWPWPRRAGGASVGGFGAPSAVDSGGCGDARCEALALSGLTRRSHSFSTIELGHALRHSAIGAGDTVDGCGDDDEDNGCDSAGDSGA